MIKFTANKIFIKYLLSNGYRQTQVHSDKHYFVNEESGSQVRICPEEHLIALIDRKGVTKNQEKSFTDIEINNFTNHFYTN